MMVHSPKRRIAVTLGDPTGVGPEIVVKALMQSSVTDMADVLVVGSPSVLQKAIELTGASLAVQPLKQFHDWKAQQSDAGTISCLMAGPDDWSTIEPRVNRKGGESAYQALCVATQLALEKKVDSFVTCPLHKVALHEAGYNWPGHTELLAELCGVRDHAMMLYLPPGQPRHGGPAGLGVVHVTLHMALRDVFQHVTIPNIMEKIGLAHDSFCRIRRSLALDGPPKIAVAALNPHGGESGRFGLEEINVIRPAVEQSQAMGINVVGPLPTDTLMPKAVDGQYDAVVAMYHDQGHIALKLLDMFDAVNITLGIPIVRTSVAHGTAHDIAWKNLARESGMIQAIRTAVHLAGS